MSITVENGIYSFTHEKLADRTLGQVREVLQQALNISPISHPLVNGHRVSEAHVLEAGDHLEFVKPGGRKEATIAAINSVLSVAIFPNEHGEPHFHVIGPDETASFAILRWRNLTGGLKRYEREIRGWWEENLNFLVEKWNHFRPTDCPVGPIHI